MGDLPGNDVPVNRVRERLTKRLERSEVNGIVQIRASVHNVRGRRQAV